VCLGLLVLLGIDAEMPLRILGESVFANELVLLLGGRLVLAPGIATVRLEAALAEAVVLVGTAR